MANPYASYQQHVSVTPQSRPIPGREHEMLANNAGGFGFVLDDWTRLHRFLILGSDGGTYYVGESELTVQNAQCVLRCIAVDGPRVVREAHEVNVSNRAPKVDQQLFAMALALKHGDHATRSLAERLLPDILRTGTHVLRFAAMLDSLGGWNRTKRRVIARWFEERDPDGLAYQVLKYRQRDGWSMRDLLRVAHPAATSHAKRAVYDWLCDRPTEGPAFIRDYTLMNSSEGSPVQKALLGIKWGLPRESLPSEALADPAVWRALLPQTPPHALLRNLGVLTANGTITNGSPDAKLVCDALTDAKRLRVARVHPFAVLLATLVYKQGRGVRGGKTWTPIPSVLSALEDAYDACFANIEPTGKRILVAVDVSGSMSRATCVGTPIAASSAAAAMAITLARAEPNAVVVRFDTAVRDVMPVTRRTGIASIERATGGGTDCASPILWASGKPHVDRFAFHSDRPSSVLGSHRQRFDAFVFLTDAETWAGQIHANQALEAYRRKFGINSKLVCCAMAANHANIVDPRDPRQLGCAGLDANLPSIVAEFIRGR